MFNFELYKEGLRKTKILAILLLIGMLLGAIILPVAEITNHARGIRYNWYWMNPVIHVYGLSASYMTLFAIFLGAPILTLSMFSFLNGRSSSDFYHAIPHKRETLFGSFIAAILTWVVAGMWLTTTISVVIYATSSHTVIHLGSIILVLMGLSATCLLVISAIVLAMTVTGTTLSNIMTSGLILFLPRLLISMFIELIVTSTGIVSSTDFGIFGNYSRNILIGLLTGGGFDNNETIDQMITRGILYTFVLAVIYLACAGYLFKKRHSELASHPGTKFTQPIIRVAVAFTMTLPAIAMIVSPDGISSDGVLGVLIFYLIAMLGYYAYEFFTTRRIGSLTKMIPGLLVVFVLNIGFILGVRAGRNMLLQEINVASISSVTIEDFSPHWSSNTYVDLNMRGLEFNDVEIIQLLGDALNDNIQAARARLRGAESNWWAGTVVRVTFNIDGGRDITRLVRVTEQSPVAGWLRDNESYRALYLVVPEDFDWASTWYDLTDEEIQHVIDVLREELLEVDFESWYQLVGRYVNHDWMYDEVTGEWLDPFQQHGTILVSGQVNGYFYQSDFPITELTPRTLELFLSYARD